ncbi:LOW QUALITY PROTEIN: DDE_4 domain-containing protein, partial [Cephalotus follicularis]
IITHHHASSWVPVEKTISFTVRKSTVTQNAMCACNFNMEFNFVYSGAGIANNSRVFLDALTRHDANFPWPSPKKYYLVDSDFSYTAGFLLPYRGERYHLKYYRGRGQNPVGHKEMFNYRHSSLHNVLERCFGVLTARFKILKLISRYMPMKQRILVVVCCFIHNFVRRRSQ